jgi:hypothetical protein
MSINYLCRKWAKNIENIHKNMLVGGRGGETGDWTVVGEYVINKFGSFGKWE